MALLTIDSSSGELVTASKGSPIGSCRSNSASAALLIARTRAAVRIEVWGELYRRGHLGLHQIHSRRASCAVSTDLIGHDGALRFYLPEGKAEMFLFKYCGQP